MPALSHVQAHQFAREGRLSTVRYHLIRWLMIPFMRVWFRLRISGGEHIPASGAAVIAPNHKSFYDPFFIAAATPRRIRFMGKSELFRGRHGRLLLALGAFPVKRGESDAEAVETARIILEQGGLLMLFPEGTRVRDPDLLGAPKRGAARLALETGAPLIPTAITGTEQLFLGPFPKPRRVQVAIGEPIPVADLPATPETAGRLIDDAVWPEVEREYGRLRARPGLIAAGLAAAGLGIAIQQRRRRRR